MSEHYTVSTSQGDGPDRLTVKAVTKGGEAVLAAMFAPDHGARRTVRATWKEGECKLVVWVEDGAEVAEEEG